MSHTIYSAFRESVQKHKKRTALKVRDGDKYTPVTYGNLDYIVSQLALGLISLGIEKGERIAIISENRPEWIYTDLASLAIGAVDVPRGVSIEDSELEFILHDCEPSIAFAETEKEAIKILRGNSSVKTIIVFDERYHPEGEMRKRGVITFNEILERGKSIDASLLHERRDTVGSNDLATIVYTSGTSGEPKGVMLSHDNIVSNVMAVPKVLPLGPKDRFIAVLPPWHTFERSVEYCALFVGASVAYSSPVNARKDLDKIRPTFMASTPLLWKKIYKRMTETVESKGGATEKIFDFFMKHGKKYIHARDIVKGNLPIFSMDDELKRIRSYPNALLQLVSLAPLYYLGDKLVYSKLRGATGGCLRGAVSGGAALLPHIDEFFRVIGIPVLEGFGQTESNAGATFRTLKHNVPGTAGRALPGIEVAIVDDYGKHLPTGEEGEIVIRGPTVMKGYWNRPELTESTIRRGWLYTGDLGRLDRRGNLSITGRKKDLIKLADGEYVAPEPLEEILKQSPYISEVMCLGHDQTFVGLLIEPNFQEIARVYSRLYGTTPVLDSIIRASDDLVLHRLVRENRQQVSQMLSDNEIINIFKRESEKLKTKADLYNRHGNSELILLVPDPFEPGVELTHTFKLRRRTIENKYKAEIAALYN